MQMVHSHSELGNVIAKAASLICKLQKGMEKKKEEK